MKFHLVVLISIACISCVYFSPSEKLLLVSGSIQGYEQCTLQVKSSTATTVPTFNTRGVSNTYREDFLVSPKGGDYDIKLICNGKLYAEKRVTHPSHKPQLNISLGVISAP